MHKLIVHLGFYFIRDDLQTLPFSGRACWQATLVVASLKYYKLHAASK